MNAMRSRRAAGCVARGLSAVILLTGQASMSGAARAEPAAVCAAAGDHHTVVALDGGVWAWGLNDAGQIGDGTTETRPAPVRVKDMDAADALAAGSRHTVALKGGAVWTWGLNDQGQLGDGSRRSRSVPARVPGLSGVVAVAAGQGHTVAIKADGTVWTWGLNSRCQLGDGTSEDRPTPIQVKGLDGVRAIAARGYHTLALKADGSVWAWGANNDGRLGDGTTERRSAPVRVVGLDDAAAVAAGRYHNAALRKDGTVVAWGCNTSVTWQLADGTTMDSRVPVPVVGLTDLPAWGKPVLPLPRPFEPLSDVSALAAGDMHTLAVMRDGTVRAWGHNFQWGQLGAGEADWRTNPMPVLHITKARALAGGKYHSVVITADGAVYTFGCNMHGQLGIGSADWAPHPTPVRPVLARNP